MKRSHEKRRNGQGVWSEHESKPGEREPDDGSLATEDSDYAGYEAHYLTLEESGVQ